MDPVDRPDVLIADRHRDVVELVAYALERAGLRVVAAHDEASVLAAAVAHQPAVIVVDTMGLRVLRHLRAASARTAIIVLSALDAEDALPGALEDRADHYLTKPFSIRQLIECISGCLLSASRVVTSAPDHTSSAANT